MACCNEKWSNWLASQLKKKVLQKSIKISEIKGQCVYFMGLHLKKDLSTDGRRGTDVTQLQLQHKNVFLVIPDQLQTFFVFNRQHFN